MICHLDYTDETHPNSMSVFLLRGQTFDAILRWFCANTNIESLPPGHLISVPAPEFLV
jgi:hypothetical protein